MLIAGEATFEGCVDKMKEKEGYSDEVAHKVCGKLEHEQAKKGPLSPDQATIAEGTTVAKAPHDLEWGFDIQGILASTRKIRGTFHVPKVDKDNEYITEEAMDKAMHDYMHLPIISEYHKERPIGLVTKSWKTKDGEYQFEGVMKETPDCDDVWQKVQKGEYDIVFDGLCHDNVFAVKSCRWRTIKLVAQSKGLRDAVTEGGIVLACQNPIGG